MHQPATIELKARSTERSLSEADIVHRFAVVSQQQNRRLYRLARGILGDSAEAEDAVQDAYVRALGHLSELDDPESLGAWLARITVNEALGRLRRRRHGIPLDEIVDSISVDAGSATKLLSPFGRENPEVAAMHAELQALLERTIDHLPIHFRVVFIACEIEEMSVAEAAAALGLYPITVKTRLYRARRLLRRALGAEVVAALPEAFPCAGERCERITAGVLARIRRAGLARKSEGEVS